jgi:hypothetical protein
MQASTEPKREPSWSIVESKSVSAIGTSESYCESLCIGATVGCLKQQISIIICPVIVLSKQLYTIFMVNFEIKD